MARNRLLLIAIVCLALPQNRLHAQRVLPTLFPEQRTIQVRDPSQLPLYRLPQIPAPSTVTRPQPELTSVFLSLDEAIRRSLINADVVRVLNGTAATTSGKTIFDVAVTNTSIDQQNARFDPTLNFNNTFNRLENPTAIFDPLNPAQALITGARVANFNSILNLNKQNALGGNWGFGVSSSPTRISPSIGPLNPQTATSANLSYTQPLLQGGGIGPNLAPIVLARIDTERSYFQFKDSVQEEVRGVIEAYWSLVAARTDLWARRRQVDQLAETVKRIKARVEVSLDNRADKAQAELALANFRANLISSEANVIQREAALRNILGIPPSDGTRLVPNSPPNSDRFEPDWDQIVLLAAERRPDLIELKLIIEADEQQLQIAKNNALPRLDAVALYRWNGLEGIAPNGTEIRSGSGQFTDWTMGVNFSVPLGLRYGRATMRRQELVIMRDRANLQQGLHNAAHQLATNVRSLDQLYEQYLAFREARIAARINMDYQLARLKTGTGILINVLQSITDWGNTVSSEASSLTQYNTLLATLERQTGTILETHGIVFYEERFGSIGPLGRFFEDKCYPKATRPTANTDMYPNFDKPAEEKFDLVPPPNLRDELPGIPYNDIKLPTLEETFPNLLDPPEQNPEMQIPPTPETKQPRSEVPESLEQNRSSNSSKQDLNSEDYSPTGAGLEQAREPIQLASDRTQTPLPTTRPSTISAPKPKSLMQKTKGWLGKWRGTEATAN
jgi:outer membrane protein TolC